ncbi:MAG: hypothetical protein ACMZI0_03660 [Symbiopectobacterium sp.]|uniref:hypothetical protein n=1 Tax=Symbiopectobacterium sp. TaxID=2952789 RepID=UPI0039EA1CEA
MTTVHIPVNSVRYAFRPVRESMQNVKFQLLKNVTQSNEISRVSGGQVREKTGLLKPLHQGSDHCVKKNLRNVRNNSNRNEAVSENVEAQKYCSEDTVGINNFLGSLTNSVDFSNEIEGDAIEFWKIERDIKGLGAFFSALSIPDSDAGAVQKIKQVLVMTKMLHDSYTDNDVLSINSIKKIFNSLSIM